MNINEFIDYMKKNTNKTMRDDQVLSLVKKTVEVKQYIPINEKKELVEKIINSCIYYDNGIYKINGIDKYVYFTMYTLAAYTNLEFSKDVEGDFDALSESKLLAVLVYLIQQEYDDVNVFLQMQCDYILENNSIEAQFGKLFDSILEKVDVVTDVVAKAIPNIDLDKLMDDKDKILNYFENINK